MTLLTDTASSLMLMDGCSCNRFLEYNEGGVFPSYGAVGSDMKTLIENIASFSKRRCVLKDSSGKYS